MAPQAALLLFIGSAVTARGVIPQSRCAVAMKALNVTGGFPGVVAHGIHDITVEDLRMFKTDIPCTGNGVPTVNRDLTSNTAVLLDSPCLGDGSPFTTVAMRAVDRELAHMDDLQYDVGRYSGLERVVHAFHMREVWAMALPHYKGIAADPPGAATCACVRDVQRNGVLEMLHLVARNIRNPDMFDGRDADPHANATNTTTDKSEERAARTVDTDGKQMGWDGNIYKYRFPSESTDKAEERAARTVDMDGKQMGWDGNIYKYRFPSESTDKADERDRTVDMDGKQMGWDGNIYKYRFPSESTDKAEEPLPRLRSESDWRTWKALMMTMMDPRYDRDLAVFLYCALNREPEHRSLV